ncbi:uncharacterized protein CELE_R02E4.1 [Caenorhabditis elegans]|uniref:Uncharacterized protein n=1 Tax=Caenorhabditis elegans TaxID=6239 RepID=Q2L6X3_CAEEL|nr:Uncharacterized protein CELE_R02E4.1 [Caenorhabditis elegans]CCD69112.1 Uncharacterized protein CELE_R02E4.1 [Caenorhabditis elegans]|eukprot:NP_508697.2 Uncharacterized protein CELE_R02E4.1 [Caenorhabditis elegans]
MDNHIGGAMNSAIKNDQSDDGANPPVKNVISSSNKRMFNSQSSTPSGSSLFLVDQIPFILVQSNRNLDFLLDNMIDEMKELLCPVGMRKSELGDSQNPMDILLQVAQVPVNQRNLRFYYLVGQVMLRATYEKKHIFEGLCQMVLGEGSQKEAGSISIKIPKHILPNDVTEGMVDVLYQSLLTRMGPSNEYINKWFDRLNENKIGEEIILKVPTTIAELKSLAVAFFDWLHANKDVFLKNSSLSKLANTPVTDLSEDKGHVQNANEIEENGNNRKENNVYVKRCRSSSI